MRNTFETRLTPSEVPRGPSHPDVGRDTVSSGDTPALSYSVRDPVGNSLPHPLPLSQYFPFLWILYSGALDCPVPTLVTRTS